MEMHVNKRYAWAVIVLLVICVAGCGGGGSDKAKVTSTSPADGATNVPTNTTITAIFTEALDATTVNDTTFLLTQAGTPVAGTVSVADRTAVFAPTAELLPNTAYQAKLTTGVRDFDGEALKKDKVWTFTTGAGPVAQTAVVLGTAAPFAVLGANSITSAGATTITGDIGTSPGSTITGFPPGTITGTQHAGDATAATARTDTITAFDTTKALTGAVGLRGDIGGLTLRPGLYKSTTDLTITSANLTLDAGGDATAVFIFQINGDLTVAATRSIILTNGATAANVFWVVSGTVNLGSTSTFVGTILADRSVTMGNSAALTGRILSRANTVSLDTNTIAAP
jgi:hypothetical protein